jgi:hypothetical protein
VKWGAQEPEEGKLARSFSFLETPEMARYENCFANSAGAMTLSGDKSIS